MAIVDVLKYEGDNKTFVWRHPKTDFNFGSQLIVHESQEAFFIYNGEIVRVFGPGSYFLETENMPLAKGALKLVTGMKNAFHMELYFVNLTCQMAIKWGTDNKIQYVDPEYGFPIEIGACGEMIVAISNSQKILTKIVGTEKMLSQEQLTINLRAFLMNRIKSLLPRFINENKINIFTIDEYLMVLSENIELKLKDDFYDYGIDLKKFLITTVLRPTDDNNYIKFRDLHYKKYNEVAEAELKQKIAIIEQQTRAKQRIIEAESIAKKREIEGYTYQQEKGFEVAKEMAKNDAVGQLNNVGVGLGMMTGVGSEIGQYVGSMANNAIKEINADNVSIKYCSNCGHKVDINAAYCELCGTKIENVSQDKCVKCGYSFTGIEQYCPRCGTRRNGDEKQ